MKSLFIRAAAAVGLCAVSFGVLAQAAEARVPASDPRLDSLSFGCGQLQDEADRLLNEYPNASPSRKDEILTRLREIGRAWYGTCDGEFGDIVIVPRGSRGGLPPVTWPTMPGTFDPHP
jgi:hypothetical protein